MPTCSVSPLRSSLRPQLHNSATNHKLRLVPCRRVGGRRLASTAAALQAAPGRTAQQQKHDQLDALTTASHHRTLTALHKTASFLPRVLPRGQAQVAQSESLEFWEGLLDRAQDDLSLSSREDAARVAVYGCDEFSGARDLVTALLEEPFSPDIVKQSIRDRWKGPQDSPNLTIRYGWSNSEPEGSGVRIRSTWLQQFPVPVEVQELSLSSLSATAKLFSADIPIIVCNPLTTPLSNLFTNPSLPLSHSNAILIITASASTLNSQELLEEVYKSVPKSLAVIFVDPTRALEALQILRSDPASALSVQRYQDGFTDSRVSDVTSTIASKLSAATSSFTERGPSPLASLRIQTALELVNNSLSACQAALKAAEREIDTAKLGMSELRYQVAELQERVGGEVLGVGREMEGVSEVKDAVEKAKKEVRMTMDRLTWWKLAWKVDDIGDTVNAAVQRAWCRELEDKLIFHTGRLSSVQKSLSESTNSFLTTFPTSSPFNSPILNNTLAQHLTSPSYPLKSTSLTFPIHTRRTQLTYPTNTLHTSAQHITIGMSGSVLGGFGVAWAGWAGQLGILKGLGMGLEAETGLAVGMLSAAVGMRWAVGGWERAKRRWWRDWDRVGEGLERDLKTTLDLVVTNQVAAIPEQACIGLSELVVKRKDEIEKLKEEMLVLEEQSGIVR